MKIAASNLELTSNHTSVVRHEQHEQLRYWEDGGRPTELASDQPGGGIRKLALALQAEHHSVQVDISGQAASLQPHKVLLSAEEVEKLEDSMVELEASVLKALVERLTGRELRIFTPADIQAMADQPPPREPVPRGEGPPPGHPRRGEGPPPGHMQRGEAPAGQAPEETREGWGLVYDYYESHFEAESTRFTAEGVVRTEDGREIAIDMELNMSRSFFTEEQLSLQAGDALKDPLVINFSGTAAQLTEEHFSFDLDLDGRADQIAFVGSGSGFLALDENGDGVINDGGELFGPSSGDGFQELAAYDADANGWIDEADPIYDRLRIWTKDADGNDQLTGLGQRGVGAIYLGRVETPFEIKDGANELLGAVRNTGLFLEEEGGAGTVQQIDLKV